MAAKIEINKTLSFTGRIFFANCPIKKSFDELSPQTIFCIKNNKTKQSLGVCES